MAQTPVDKNLELDAATLTREEWFFLAAAFGQRPGASRRDISEWHRQALGLPKAQQHVIFKQGLESLIARGFIVQERDQNGSLVFDRTGQPVYKGVGRIVSRVTEYNAPKN